MRAARAKAAELAGAVARSSGASVPERGAVWNFGFGANLDPQKLIQKRGINPLEVIPGSVSGLRLAFNHRGGFGNLVPAEGCPPAATLSPNLPQPSVNGVLLLLKFGDFETLAGMEHQYEAKEVTVEAYDGRKIVALAFITQPSFVTLRSDLLPTSRYIGLIRRGAHQMGIAPAYTAWLDQVPSIPDDKRGPEYYVTHGAEASAAAPSESNSSEFEHKKRSNRRRRKRRVAPETENPLNGTDVCVARGKPGGFAVTQDSVYVSFPERHLVQEYSLSDPESKGRVCVGGNGRGAAIDQLNRPWRIAVGAAGELLICDRNNARVLQGMPGLEVTLMAGGTQGHGLSQLNQPVDVAVHQGEIYVSDRANHRVITVNESGGSRVVAGGNGWGSDLNQLACPAAIHVTADSSLYVCDEANNRVVVWTPGANEASLVAGGEGAGGSRH